MCLKTSSEGHGDAILFFTLIYYLLDRPPTLVFHQLLVLLQCQVLHVVSQISVPGLCKYSIAQSTIRMCNIVA